MSNFQFSMASLNEALDATTDTSISALISNTTTPAATTIPGQQATSTLAATITISFALVAPTAQMVQTNPATGVFPFDKFPVELRKDVLDLICNFVRVVTIHENDNVNTETSDGRPRMWRNYMAKATCITGRLPAVLHVNREFRTHGLKIYQAAFQHRLRNKPIYFNFAKDVLYIPDQAAWKSLTRSKEAPFPSFVKAVSDKLKHLIIKGSLTEKMEIFLGGVFGGLEALVLHTHVRNIGSHILHPSLLFSVCLLLLICSRYSPT
jgi:hypothetical protein